MNRSIPKALHRRGNCPLGGLPEFQLLVPGGVLSLVWEILQSPFYADTFTSSWVTVALNRLHCAGGDVVILLAAFWIVTLRWGRSWMRMSCWSPYMAFLALGVVYTAGSEYVNGFVRQSWAYRRWMPTMAGIGLVPLLQWVIVPSVSVQFARGGMCIG